MYNLLICLCSKLKSFQDRKVKTSPHTVLFTFTFFMHQITHRLFWVFDAMHKISTGKILRVYPLNTHYKVFAYQYWNKKYIRRERDISWIDRVEQKSSKRYMFDFFCKLDKACGWAKKLNHFANFAKSNLDRIIDPGKILQRCSIRRSAKYTNFR